MKQYAAPWSKALVIISTLTTLLGVVMTFLPCPGANSAPSWILMARTVPTGLIAGCALFTIRGYRLTPDAIVIQRLIWSTRLPLTGLRSADHQPDAMRAALRTCGNGGLFSFTGYYWNRRLGPFRAFVMDPRRAVVLHYARRTLVLSPADPEEFVQAIRTLKCLG